MKTSESIFKSKSLDYLIQFLAGGTVPIAYIVKSIRTTVDIKIILTDPSFWGLIILSLLVLWLYRVCKEQYERIVVLNRKLNAVKRLEEHDISGLGFAIGETFSMLNNSLKDAIIHYSKSPNVPYNPQGLTQSINNLMKKVSDTHNQQRQDILNQFNDNEYR